MEDHSGETVLRTEYERMMRVADDRHSKFMAQLLENHRLIDAMTAAKSALDAEHRPEPDGRCCVVCGPQDGSWPCVSRLIADDLDAAHIGRCPSCLSTSGHLSNCDWPER